MPVWLIVVIVIAVLIVIGNLGLYAEKRDKETIVERTEQFLAGSPQAGKIADRYFRIRKRTDYGNAGDVALQRIMDSDTPQSDEARRLIRERLQPIQSHERWLAENYGAVVLSLVGWGISRFRMPGICCRCGEDGDESLREREISSTFSLPSSTMPTKLSLRLPFCAAGCGAAPESSSGWPDVTLWWRQDQGGDRIEVAWLHNRFVHAFDVLNPRAH